MKAMQRDDQGMFGGNGWTTHTNDMKGRLAKIAAMISLGKLLGCDMSEQIKKAKDLLIPESPK